MLPSLCYPGTGANCQRQPGLFSQPRWMQRKGFKSWCQWLKACCLFLIVNKNPLKNADQDQDTIGNQTDWHWLATSLLMPKVQGIALLCDLDGDKPISNFCEPRSACLWGIHLPSQKRMSFVIDACYHMTCGDFEDFLHVVSADGVQMLSNKGGRTWLSRRSEIEQLQLRSLT